MLQRNCFYQPETFLWVRLTKILAIALRNTINSSNGLFNIPHGLFLVEPRLLSHYEVDKARNERGSVPLNRLLNKRTEPLGMILYTYKLTLYEMGKIRD